MSGRFGAQIGPFAACAAQRLGWRPDDFWGATPADLYRALAPVTQADATVSRDDINALLERDSHE
ncbi:MAG: phage tail assembly chaperone [Pontixanthobacter sp.]